jgi:hypothetical protein
VVSLPIIDRRAPLANDQASKTNPGGSDDAKENDASFGLPPCDAENEQATGKAILHNAALCRAPGAGGQ